MVRKVPVLWMSIAAMSAIPIHAANVQFVPSAGYSANEAQRGGIASTNTDAPTLARIPDVAISSLFNVYPTYKRGVSTGHVKVVGAFEITETQKRHLTGVWSPCFLPVTLSFSDGQCYSLHADYIGRTLLNGRLSKVGCDSRNQADEQIPIPPPGRPLRLIGSAWTLGA